MKRKIILIAVTLCLLAAFGALLHSPPSLLDAISGATRRARARNIDITNIIAPSEYTLFINTDIPPLNDGATRLAIRQSVLDEAAAERCSLEPIYLGLAVVDGNRFLSERADMIVMQLETVGIDAQICEYSEMMFLSRAVYGKYDLLLIADGEPALPDLADAESIVIADGGEAD